MSLVVSEQSNDGGGEAGTSLAASAADAGAAGAGAAGAGAAGAGVAESPGAVGDAAEIVLYDAADGVATIALNDPKTRNALSVEMLNGLIAAFERADADDEARAVVLRSSHERTFSSGANLGGFSADAPLIHKHFGTERFVSLFKLIGSLSKPTLCAVSGHVLAGSVGIALSCDLVIASEQASFGTPEINIGTFPFMVMAVLYRNAGRKDANELLLLGERFDAARAKEAGLVNKVVPVAELDAAVAEWAGRLASRSPVIMRLGKQAMRRQLDMALDDALDYLRSQLTLATSTEDIVEGVTAFFEKREPVWKGR
jgi:enoyl-CoA hydratase/carnithine racemase